MRLQCSIYVRPTCLLEQVALWGGGTGLVRRPTFIILASQQGGQLKMKLKSRG